MGFRVLQEPRNGGLPRTWWASAYTVTWSSRRWASVYECLLETAGGLPRISAGCGEFLCVRWASVYAIVGFRVLKSGPPCRAWWVSVYERVGFRVAVYKEARGT